MSPGPRNRDPIYCFRSPLEEEPVLPNRPAKCPWTKDLHKFEQSPHGEWAWKPSDGKILPSILKAVGNTPLVKLNKIPKAENIECEIYGKCEFMNPTGSIKERMVLRCIDDAEKCGTLKPGMTIIETTSGNTGIALAWICAVKGYKCIIVLSDKSSKEKEDIIKAFGATVERYPLGEDPLSENGKYGKSHYLHKQTPNSIILDQFSNPSNAVAHYDNTAEEIYYQCDGQVDMIITAAGSGGTTTGIGRKFKEISPNTIIIGADPYSSLFAEPPEINKTDVKFSEVEGIGDKIIPTICDRHNIDKWFKLYDNESLNMARRLIKEEGLLVGSSSGTMMAAALKAIKYFNLGKGKKVVVLFPDGTTNYLTKFIVDQWMEQRNLIDAKNTHNYWWWDINIMQLAFKSCQNVDHLASPREVLALMNELNVDYLPAVKDGVIVGLATKRNVLNHLIAGESPNDEINNCLVRMFSKLPKESSLGLASRVLEIQSYVVILENDGQVDKALGVVTSDDVFSFIEHYKPK
ncbi:cystathionine beta-synthase-like isoform X2 [Diabrotica virgifera virgifera]|uniref:CBS domain-containing protein n=1 Tax=Diabrotica virgifera virgifera TaxID=50390 RepID=A0ABM5KJD0_DIAVI|nr:cystathionine beta-synthase-like isoform X2 [Diabrotica virgifera virgifera]